MTRYAKLGYVVEFYGSVNKRHFEAGTLVEVDSTTSSVSVSKHPDYWRNADVIRAALVYVSALETLALVAE